MFWKYSPWNECNLFKVTPSTEHFMVMLIYFVSSHWRYYQLTTLPKKVNGNHLY